MQQNLLKSGMAEKRMSGSADVATSNAVIKL